MANNLLYYGDNPDILRRYVKDDSVDLVYLDPPFKSNQDDKVLFAEQDGCQRIDSLADNWICRPTMDGQFPTQ